MTTKDWPHMPAQWNGRCTNQRLQVKKVLQSRHQMSHLVTPTSYCLCRKLSSCVAPNRVLCPSLRLHAFEAHRANLLCPPSEEISRQVLSFGQCWKSSANLWHCTSTAPYSTCSQMLLVRFISTHLHYLAWASWASTFASNVRHKWSWCLDVLSNI